MSSLEARLKRLELLSQETKEAKKRWELWEDDRSDGKTAVGPGGVRLTQDELNEYAKEHNIIHVVWAEEQRPTD